MDRRLPTVLQHVLRASVVSVVAWSHGHAAWAAELEAQAIPVAAKGAGSGSSAGGWISAVVVLAASVVAAWMWFRRARRSITGAGGIAVIDRTSMGGGRSLALVRVGDRVVLVGESAQGFQRLAEFDAESDAAVAFDEVRAGRRLAS